MKSHKTQIATARAVRPAAMSALQMSLLAVLMTLALLLALPRHAGAQSAEVPVGARVRLRAEYPYGTVVGRVERVDRQVLRVVQDRTTAGLVVPMRYVQSLEMRRGRSRFEGMRWGALRGAVVGAGAGLLLGAVTDGNVAAFGAAGLGVGAAGGAAYGIRQPGLTWQRVEIVQPVRSARR